MALRDIPSTSRETQLNTRPPLALKDVVYNVAIGSNMDGARLRSRSVGDDRRINPLSEGVPCRVPGWALSFDFIVLPPIEPVMCGAVPRDGDELHGVLWKLTREDYDFLARTEACLNPNSTYVEREVLAIPYDGGPPVRALVFALRNPIQAPPLLYPSARYKNLMVEGSRAAKLDSTVVQKLENMPSARPCHSNIRGFSLFTLIAMFSLFKYNLMMNFIAQYYRPLLASLYSRRERELVNGNNLKGRVWTTALLLAMMPMATLGFVRALSQGRDVRKIASGQGLLSK